MAGWNYRMSVFDILIKNCLVYDGSASGPFISDIGIAGDKIRYVGGIQAGDAGMVIDAEGLAVSPGFIDVHAHSDFSIVADPRAEGKLFQGVTTEINGNCGVSAAPLYNQVLEKRQADLKEFGISERWNTLEEYFRIIEKKGIAVNLATLAGHGNIRGSVIGYSDRGPAGEELAGMSGLLEITLEQGAIGLSAGLIYPPGVFSTTEELVLISKALKERSLIYTCHMRSEGDTLLESMHEVIRIGREAGIKVNISHIKTAGERNWHKAEEATGLLYEARRKGVRITVDRYPYIASCTDLDSILPSWAVEGGNEEEIARLENATEREKIRKEMVDGMVSGDYWRNVVVSSVASEKNRWMEGVTIADIGRHMKMDELDLFFRILVEERLKVGCIFSVMSEENLKKFLSLPFCMIGSDSSARCFDGPTKKGRPHPRGFGTFPRYLGKYVRDEGLMTLSEAINRSTFMPAETFGLRGRGLLKEGMYADIVIFDPLNIRDRATYDDPFLKPEGIHYVLVNGVVAVREGQPVGKLAGRVLKPGR